MCLTSWESGNRDRPRGTTKWHLRLRDQGGKNASKTDAETNEKRTQCENNSHKLDRHREEEHGSSRERSRLGERKKKDISLGGGN